MKNSCIRILISAVIILAVIDSMLAYALFCLNTKSDPIFKNLEYSSWMSSDDTFYIEIREKYDVNSENGEYENDVYSCIGEINGQDINGFFNANANTVTLFKNGETEKLAFGYVEYDKNEMTIEFKHFASSEINETVHLLKS